MKTYTYGVCPDCGHVKVHVENGAIVQHYATAIDRLPCSGTGKPPSEKSKLWRERFLNEGKPGEHPKHTPGPWVAHYFPFGHKSSAGLYVVTDPPKVDEPFVGQVIASQTTCPDWEANARLIASAPDLLEAARIGLAACIAWGGKCEAKGETTLAAESVIQAEKIRAAIAKATL